MFHNRYICGWEWKTGNEYKYFKVYDLNNNRLDVYNNDYYANKIIEIYWYKKINDYKAVYLADVGGGYRHFITLYCDLDGKLTMEGKEIDGSSNYNKFRYTDTHYFYYDNETHILRYLTYDGKWEEIQMPDFVNDVEFLIYPYIIIKKEYEYCLYDIYCKNKIYEFVNIGDIRIMKNENKIFIFTHIGNTITLYLLENDKVKMLSNEIIGDMLTWFGFIFDNKFYFSSRYVYGEILYYNIYYYDLKQDKIEFITQKEDWDNSWRWFCIGDVYYIEDKIYKYGFIVSNEDRNYLFMAYFTFKNVIAYYNTFRKKVYSINWDGFDLNNKVQIKILNNDEKLPNKRNNGYWNFENPLILKVYIGEPEANELPSYIEKIYVY